MEERKMEMDWNGSVVKPPSFEDEGALHIGKGKFLLFMSGANNDKTISARKRLIVTIIAVALVVSALLITTLLVGHQANQMPYETKLSLLLGSDLPTVTEQLELSQSEWTEKEKGVYQLNQPCKLSGVPFKLQLNFDQNGRMNGYSYKAEYDADYKKAALDLYKIAIDLNVLAYLPDDAPETDLRKSALKNQFNQGTPLILNVTSANTYENLGDDPVGKYLDDLEAAEDWPGRVGDYIVRQAVSYYEIRMEYTPETESVLIHIICQIEPERTN